MHLTDSEYQSFKTYFHCTALPDEQYRIPIEVETPAGNANWTAYIAGDQFHAGVGWISGHRGNSRPIVVIAGGIAPIQETKSLNDKVFGHTRFPGNQTAQHS